MGFLRFVLAVSVVIHHGGRFGETLWSLRLVAADMAILLFFIISGYYMMMTLERNYLGRPRGVLRFYANRGLRLYPIYWICTFVPAIGLLAIPGTIGRTNLANFPAFRDATADNLGTQLLMDFANLAIVGTDWLMAAGTDFHRRYALNAPAWTIAIELGFYLVAPLIAIATRRWWLLAVLTLASFYRVPFGGGASFINQSMYFMFGVAAYRIGEAMRARLDPAWFERIGAGILGLVALYLATALLAYGYVPPFYEAPKTIGDAVIAVSVNSTPWTVFYGCFALALPFVFYASRRSRVDDFLGGLSYPIYIVHWPLFYLCVPIMQRLKLPVPSQQLGTIAIVLAVALYVLVDRPIARLRADVRPPRQPDAPSAGVQPRQAALNPSPAGSAGS